jgi:hypothetical protein
LNFVFHAINNGTLWMLMSDPLSLVRHPIVMAIEGYINTFTRQVTAVTPESPGEGALGAINICA